MQHCLFCEIAGGRVPATVLHHDDDLVAFLDIAPVRRGHAQIVPRVHVETFDRLDSVLAAKVVHLGQQLARRMKVVYGVERVAFAFTGGDVAHVHAHVIPMVEKTDVTSARYIVSPSASELKYGSSHLHLDAEALAAVKHELNFLADQT